MAAISKEEITGDEMTQTKLGCPEEGQANMADPFCTSASGANRETGLFDQPIFSYSSSPTPSDTHRLAAGGSAWVPGPDGHLRTVEQRMDLGRLACRR